MLLSANQTKSPDGPGIRTRELGKSAKQPARPSSPSMVAAP